MLTYTNVRTAVQSIAMMIVLGASAGCPGKDEETTDSDTAGTDPTDTDTTDTATTDTATTDTDTAGELACSCIADDPPEEWPSYPTCGEDLCAKIQADSPQGTTCYYKNLTVMDDAAVECALTALRDRTPGLLRWACNDDTAQVDESGYILILADGNAIRRTWGQEDLQLAASDALSGAMPDPSVFTDCLAMATSQERYECLTSFELGAPTQICDEAWSVSHGI